MKKFLTLAFAVMTLASFSQESVLLRVKYNKGDQYLMKMTMTQNSGEGAILMRMDMNMKIDVKDVQDTIYDAEMSFTRMAIDMKQGGMNMKYDSDMKDEDLDPAGQQMKMGIDPVMNMVIGAKTTNRGELVDMTIMEGVGDVEQFKQSNNTVVYPKEAVKVGSTWTEVKVTNGMKMNYTYTVESIEKESVLLAVIGTLTDGAEGNFTGTMNLNRANGLPNEAKIDMDMKMMGQDVKSTVNFTFEKM